MITELVSVIIPVYNVLPYLREALDSVVNQTYQNLEIIIVDDGSTDGSAAVCDEYGKDPRVKVIHQENKGLSGARNTGLDLMTGSYVAFLDSDDAFYPEMIEKTLNRLLEAQADMVVCGYKVYKTTKRLDLSRPIGNCSFEDEMLSAREVLNKFVEGAFDWTIWNKLYTCKLWDEIRFPEGYVFEDIRTMPIILEQCMNVAIMNDTLIYHRKRNGSITHTLSAKNLQDYIVAENWILDFVKQRTPEIISRTNGDCFIENNIRQMANICSRWTLLLHKYARRELRSVILPKCKEMLGCTKRKKTMITCWLFIYCPWLLPIARAFYRCYKRGKKS